MEVKHKLLKRVNIKMVPNEYKFNYMRSFQKLIEIRDCLKNFDIEKDEQILKEKLFEYRSCFKIISEINELVDR